MEQKKKCRKYGEKILLTILPSGCIIKLMKDKKDKKLQKLLTAQKILKNGICEYCGTPLWEDTDGTLICNGCGATYTPPATRPIW